MKILTDHMNAQNYLLLLSKPNGGIEAKDQGLREGLRIRLHEDRHVCVFFSAGYRVNIQHLLDGWMNEEKLDDNTINILYITYSCVVV